MRDTYIHTCTQGEEGSEGFSIYIAVRSVVFGGQFRFGSVRYRYTELNRTEIDHQESQTEPLRLRKTDGALVLSPPPP